MRLDFSAAFPGQEFFVSFTSAAFGSGGVPRL